MINFNLRKGVHVLNSKNEYNRCIIQPLGINLATDEMIEEFEENEKERKLKREIQKLKESIRYEKLPKEKKIKLMCDKEINDNSRYQLGQIRGVIVSSLKGSLKKEIRRKES